MWPFKSKKVVPVAALPLPQPSKPAPAPVPPVATSGYITPAEPKVRLPRVGDPVWWAPKGLECTVVSVGLLGFTFVGGEEVKDSKGRMRPRWTVYTGFDHIYDESVKSWIVGQGPTPKNVRGIVITPDVVKVDLSAYIRKG